LSDLILEQLASLEGNSIVIMPNDSSSRQLRDKLAFLRGSHEQAFLETISIMPIEQFLAELWDSSFPDKQVLRPIQVQALADKVIQQSGILPPTSLNAMAITRQFVRAFNLHEEYLLPSQPESYLFSQEYEAFAVWSESLQRELDNISAITGSQLPSALTGLVTTGAITLPDAIIVSELVWFSPSVKEFIRVLEEAGIQRHSFVGETFETRPMLVSEPLRNAECQSIAAWASDYLSSNPDAGNVAILVPDMNAYRLQLHNSLALALHPACLAPTSTSTACPPWTFDAADKLISQPSIRAAWDIISLTRHRLPAEHISRVLRSRYVTGWPEMRDARAQLDLHWRGWLGPQSTLTYALANQDISIESCHAAVQFMTDIEAYLAEAPYTQLPSLWVRYFDQMLLKAGWPNVTEDKDDSVLPQCLRGLSQTLDVFRALDTQLGEITHSEALTWLQHILSTKKFSIATDWHTPIRIMSYDDALGMTFDALWIAGLDDSVMPARAEPNPFLPIHLQQDAGIPESEPSLMLARDSHTLTGLLRSSPNVTVSHARQNEVGAPAHLSTLIVDPIQINPMPLKPAIDFVASVNTFESDLVSAVPVGDSTQLRGGTGLFKEYATSPLFAFLKFRLGLKEFPKIEEGLDYRVQGILLHAALQHFWTVARTKSAVQSMTDSELTGLIDKSIAEAFSTPSLPWGRYGKAVIGLEKRRLTAIIHAWITQVELARPEDFTVIDVERARKTVFMGIPIKIFIDRVDSVEGRTLLIDYKTGRIDGKTLNATELTEPQLPIYALAEKALGTNVEGVMLASLKGADNLAVHSRATWHSNPLSKGSKSSNVDTSEKWEDQLKAWDTALQSIASGIIGGDISHRTAQDHRRGFSAYLLPLLRGQQTSEVEGE
jgi:ATP-dependent helicase/nuclease subunit B